MRVLAVLVSLALVAAGVGAWLVYVPAGPAAGTPDAQAVFVDIAPGSGTQAIAQKLESAGVVRSRYAFELMRVAKGGTLKAGEYRFDHPADVAEVYGRIARGDVYTVALTIPEGYNIFDIAGAVAAAGLGNKDAFLEAERKDADLIADLSPGAVSLEGFLYPDTYRFARTATPEVMLGAMVRRFRQAAAGLGITGEGGRSVEQIVTTASLVEKEVAVPGERPLVAGVFRNRLEKGMPLQTDPSIIYGAELAGRWRGTIYASDLQFQSAYNTYKHAGLPPGPICNPGAASLKAAMHPADTDYLYFVADAQGHSRFAATMDEHEKNVHAYRAAIGEVKAPAALAAPAAAAPVHGKKKAVARHRR